MAIRHPFSNWIAWALILFGMGATANVAFSDLSGLPYSQAQLLRCTHEPAILHALELLNQTRGQESLEQVVKHPVRIVFKDMQTLHKSLKNYDALSWLSNQGEHVIFINEKHRQAPPAALAAMIAHEALHADPFNSVREEVYSWRQEALVWSDLKARHPELGKIPKGTNPLVDRENRIELEVSRGTLDAFVRNNPGYQGLPESSPGFNSQTALND